MKRTGKEILKDRSGASFPLTIALVLVLFLLLCVISEYFRLQIITAGVREAVQDAVICVVNDHYAGVYHGVREGYSGSYVPYSGGTWETELNEGDVYAYLDELIGTKKQNGRHMKYGSDGNTMEFAIDDLEVTIRNAPLAPSDPENVQKFEADAMVRLEVPVHFGGKLLPSLFVNLKVQAGYTEIF